MKKYVFLALALMLLLTMAGCGAEANVQPEPDETESQPEAATTDALPTGNAGFDTPEAAIRAYLEGLRDSDLDRMISAFAVERSAENLDFEAYVEWLQIYTPEMGMPNVNELVTAMNVETRRAHVVDMITQQYFLLCFPERDMAETQTVEDASTFTSQFTEALNAPDLQTLELLGFIPPELLDVDERYASEGNQEHIALLVEIAGADQLESRVAVFELNGNKHLLFVETINYGGEWFVGQFGGGLSRALGFPPFMQGIAPSEFVDEFGIDLQAVMISD